MYQVSMTRCSNLLVVVLLLFSFAATAQTASARKKEKLQEEQVKLQDQIDFIQTLLKETTAGQDASLGQLQTLNRKIEIRKQLIRSIDNEVKLLEKEIEEMEVEIDTLEAEIERSKKAYADMIYKAYKSKNKHSRVMFILSSEDFNQAYKRLKYLQKYAEYRRKQADLIELKKTELTVTIGELEKQKQDKIQLGKNKETELASLQNDITEQEKTVVELKGKEKEIKKDLKQKQKEADRVSKQIKKIIAEEIKRERARAAAEAKRKAEEEAKRRAAENATASTEATPVVSYALTPEAKLVSDNFTTNKGKLPWPIERAVVIGNFGKHTDDKTGLVTTNDGVDMVTAKGSKARAAFKGTVVQVLIISGKGKAIIISHGDYYTVYQNLSEVYVKNGDSVEPKQELGSILTNPITNQTVLHFELWKNLNPQNPVLWLYK